MVDSFYYNSTWHNSNFINTKNYSLEKINPRLNPQLPESWTTSVDPNGGTPARENSVFTESTLSNSKVTISPNPFSPDNDGFEDFTFIDYSLSQPVVQIRVKVFDSRGRLVRTLANNIASGSKGTLVFDGKDDFGNSLRVGIYILLIESLNESSGTIDVMKEVVVVARKL